MAEQQTLHLETYESSAKNLIASAQSLADSQRHKTVDPIHLLACMLQQNDVVQIVQQLGVDVPSLVRTASSLLDRLPMSDGELSYLSGSMTGLLKRAEKEAREGSVRVEHLLNALAQEIRGEAGKVLQQFNIGPGAFRGNTSALKIESVSDTSTSNTTYARDLISRARAKEYGPLIGRSDEVLRLLQIMARSSKNNPLLVGDSGSGKTALVGEIATRFSKREVPPTIARMAFVEVELNALNSGVRVKSEVEERIKSLLNEFKQNNQQAILVIEGIENLINQSPALNISDLFKMLLTHNDIRVFGTTTPDALRKMMEKDPSFVRHFTALTIDPATPEQAIEILRGMAPRLEKYHGVSIGEPAITAAVSLSKRYIQDKVLPESAISVLDEAAARFTIEKTGLPAALDRDVRRLDSLRAQFNKLNKDQDPMSQKALRHVQQEMEALEPKVSELRNQLTQRRDALSSVHVLREEYQKTLLTQEQAQKKGNFAVLGELEHVLLPKLKSQLQAAEEVVDRGGYTVASNVVDQQQVAEIVGAWTGIPVAKMLEEETEKLLKMEERLGKRVLGQEEVIKAVSRAVRRSRVGLRNAKQPIGSFLFLGSSGTGKTETAKALAEFLFDDENAMTRFDMSEFQERHMTARFLGAPVGYQGAERGGELVEAIRKHPYSVLLFDEIEKAHADIFNILLAMLEDGRVSSATGETADCSNTVIIMTSNLGSRKILEADDEMFLTEEGQEQMKEMLLGEVANFLRPEFINRINDLMVFRPLSKPVLRGIVDIEIKKVEKLLEERELKLLLSESSKNVLIEEGFDSAMGARPLKRAIIRRVQDPLVEKLLSSRVKNGSTISIDVDSEQRFTFSS